MSETSATRSLSPSEQATIDQIAFDERGLVPAIVQDYLDGAVLMLAWMNRESLTKTLETGHTWFWSRSRQSLWPKGQTSGHWQIVKGIRFDCDRDALLVSVEQIADIACHTGARSCFFRDLADLEAGSGLETDPITDTLSQVFGVVRQRQADPRPGSYTSQLFAKGTNTILKKLGEETAEVVMACKDGNPESIVNEVADLWYHCLVALAHNHVDIRDVYRQLQARRQ